MSPQLSYLKFYLKLQLPYRYIARQIDKTFCVFGEICNALFERLRLKLPTTSANNNSIYACSPSVPSQMLIIGPMPTSLLTSACTMLASDRRQKHREVLRQISQFLCKQQPSCSHQKRTSPWGQQLILLLSSLLITHRVDL